MKQIKQPLYWIYRTTQRVEFDRHRELHKQLKEKQKKTKKCYICTRAAISHVTESATCVSNNITINKLINRSINQ